MMCPCCHDQYGVSFGVGLGQEYRKHDDGSWATEKIRKPTD
jgi:hypothetical protein